MDSMVADRPPGSITGGRLECEAAASVGLRAIEPMVAPGTHTPAGLPVGHAASAPSVGFAAGTRILTGRGKVAVEALVEGDSAITHVGERRRVRWIACRRTDLACHSRNGPVAPVRICAGAFAEGQPNRDLVVLPDHQLLVDDTLIAARVLVNGMTIRQEGDTAAVKYYNLALDRHAMLLAEGMPAECPPDGGNRFSSTGAAPGQTQRPVLVVNGRRHTDECETLPTSLDAVQPICRRLRLRAYALGHQPAPPPGIPDDPLLRIAFGGRSFHPLAWQDGRYSFALPSAVASLRLLSRSAAASHKEAHRDDPRRLGVAVRRILLRDGRDVIEMPTDHPNLTQGWYGVEHDTGGMWRWTDGDAMLNLPEAHTPRVLEIHVVRSPAYPGEDTAPPVAHNAYPVQETAGPVMKAGAVADASFASPARRRPRRRATTSEMATT